MKKKGSFHILRYALILSVAVLFSVLLALDGIGDFFDTEPVLTSHASVVNVFPDVPTTDFRFSNGDIDAELGGFLFLDVNGGTVGGADAGENVTFAITCNRSILTGFANSPDITGESALPSNTYVVTLKGDASETSFFISIGVDTSILGPVNCDGVFTPFVGAPTNFNDTTNVISVRGCALEQVGGGINNNQARYPYGIRFEGYVTELGNLTVTLSNADLDPEKFRFYFDVQTPFDPSMPGVQPVFNYNDMTNVLTVEISNISPDFAPHGDGFVFNIIVVPNVAQVMQISGELSQDDGGGPIDCDLVTGSGSLANPADTTVFDDTPVEFSQSGFMFNNAGGILPFRVIPGQAVHVVLEKVLIRRANVVCEGEFGFGCEFPPDYVIDFGSFGFPTPMEFDGTVNKIVNSTIVDPKDIGLIEYFGETAIVQNILSNTGFFNTDIFFTVPLDAPVGRAITITKRQGIITNDFCNPCFEQMRFLVTAPGANTSPSFLSFDPPSQDHQKTYPSPIDVTVIAQDANAGDDVTITLIGFSTNDQGVDGTGLSVTDPNPPDSGAKTLLVRFSNIPDNYNGIVDLNLQFDDGTVQTASTHSFSFDDVPSTISVVSGDVTTLSDKISVILQVEVTDAEPGDADSILGELAFTSPVGVDISPVSPVSIVMVGGSFQQFFNITSTLEDPTGAIIFTVNNLSRTGEKPTLELSFSGSVTTGGGRRGRDDGPRDVSPPTIYGEEIDYSCGDVKANSPRMLSASPGSASVTST